MHYDNFELFTFLRIPLVGVSISVSNVTLASNYDKFNVCVTCGIDRGALSIAHWDESRIGQVYELPDNATFIIHFVNSQI